MIKARAKGKKDIIPLGLSDLNMLRLSAGQPIRFSLQDLGSDLPPVEVVIYNGRTEDSMQTELQALITEQTQYVNTKEKLQ